MAVVKANAYGHGLVRHGAVPGRCRRVCAWRAWKRRWRCAALACARPIVLLEGVLNAEQLAEAARHNLEIVVHEREQLALLEQRARRPSFRGVAEDRYRHEPAWISCRSMSMPPCVR